jgi:hypothetical protein
LDLENSQGFRTYSELKDTVSDKKIKNASVLLRKDINIAINNGQSIENFILASEGRDVKKRGQIDIKEVCTTKSTYGNLSLPEAKEALKIALMDASILPDIGPLPLDVATRYQKQNPSVEGGLEYDNVAKLNALIKNKGNFGTQVAAEIQQTRELFSNMVTTFSNFSSTIVGDNTPPPRRPSQNDNRNKSGPGK